MINKFENIDNVILKPYDPSYSQKFEAEKRVIEKLFEPIIVSIDHIGSTAIPNILSKPIIDISIVVSNFPIKQYCIETLQSYTYIYWDTNPEPLHQFFFKSMPRTHHLHFYPVGHNKPTEEILFRDYLLKHIEIAKEYESLKVVLAKKYKKDREKYTEAKTEFIKSVLRQCKS